MVDWKISAGAVLGILLSVLLAHLLAKRREDDKIFKAETIAFKEYLIPMLKELESSDSCVSTIIMQYHSKCDDAARKLVLYLPDKKAKIFASIPNSS